MLCIGFWCPGDVMAPPIGTSDKHKPHKTRVSRHPSSCNRRILVYDIVYDFIRTQSTHGDCS